MPRLYISGNAVDQNQVPVVGALIYVRAAGVNASLQDVAGDALANPLITVADGFFEAFSTSTGTHTLEYYWGGRSRRVDTVSEIDRIQAIADEAADSADAAVSARDATLIYKQDAEAAALPLPAIADAVDADRVAAELASTQAQAANTAAQGVIFNIIPIAQSALLANSGDVVLIGTGAVAPATDTGVVIGREAGLDYGLTGGTGAINRKPTFIGQNAGEFSSGYALAYVGTYAGSRTAVEHGVGIGTHAHQEINVIGKVVHGFGPFATGTATFTGLPGDGDTITLAGVAFTFRTSASTTYEVQIGGDAPATVINLYDKIAAAPDAALRVAMYRPGTGANTNRLEITAAGRGAWGNAITLATISGAVALSASTLSGGADHTNLINGNGGFGAGFLANCNGDFGTLRPAHGYFEFVSNPADGDRLILGNSPVAFTFRTVVTVPATEILIGATAAATAANAARVLRASTNGNVTPCDFHFWPSTSPRVYAVFKTNAGDSYRLQSRTAAVTAPSFLYGAVTSFPNASTGIGFSANRYHIGGDSTVLGSDAGRALQGVNNLVYGNNAAFFTQTSGSFIAAPLGGQTFRGDHILAIGSGINNGTQGAFRQITGVTSNGIVTFAEPHGWIVGEEYACTQRNTITGSNLIKRNGSNLPSSANGIQLQAISATQAIFFAGIAPDLPQPTYTITGTATQIEISRTVSYMSHAMAFGRSAVLEPLTMSFGSTLYTGGAKFRGGNLQNPDGGLLINSTPFIPATPSTSVGPCAQGSVLISGTVTDGDTITANGTAFTFKDTPTTGSTQVQIGATARQNALNFIEVFNAYNPNRTQDRPHRHARVSIQQISGSQQRIVFVCEAYTGNTYTLAASGANLTPTGATLTGSTLGTLPDLSNANVRAQFPDGVQVRTQHHPRHGLVGYAMADHVNQRWIFV